MEVPRRRLAGWRNVPAGLGGERFAGNYRRRERGGEAAILRAVQAAFAIAEEVVLGLQRQSGARLEGEIQIGRLISRHQRAVHQARVVEELVAVYRAYAVAGAIANLYGGRIRDGHHAELRGS